MEFLRNLFVQTQSQLRGLTPSQRLAIGSCVGLIAIALLWLVNWASAPQRVPLLDMPMTAEELGPIQQRLDAMDVSYEMSGDVILVPIDDRSKLLAKLERGKLLPQNISLGFRDLFQEQNAFQPPAAQEFRRGVALSNELSGVIRDFDDVSEARVFMNTKTRRKLGQAPIVQTASVFVTPAAGVAMNKGLVRAVASFVSRAAGGGMSISSVAVIDSVAGRSYSVPEQDPGLPTEDIDLREKTEKYFAGQIKGLLAGIPNVEVAVHADLTTKSMIETDEKYGKPGIIKEEMTSSEIGRSKPADGPGVGPNTAVEVANAGGGETLVEKTTTTTNESGRDLKVTRSDEPRNTFQGCTAAVLVPRSYFVGIYRMADPDTDPTDADLAPISTRELAKITGQVVQAVGATGIDQVQVDWYYDQATVLMGQAVMQAGVPEGMVGYVRAYGSKAGMAALAMMSLVMMLRMVRKVGEGPVLPGEEPPQPGRLRKRGGHDELAEMELEGLPVGEAQASEQALEGLEVDPTTLKTQRMVEQINELVTEDLEGSVSILEQWMQRSQS